MSVKNKKLVKKIIGGFTNKNIDLCLTMLADDFKWNIVGMPTITGKQDFIKAMETLYLWQAAPDFSQNFREHIIAEGDFVVIENAGYSLNKCRNINQTGHCDIYLINDGKIKEITTYIVDTSVIEV